MFEIPKTPPKTYTSKDYRTTAKSIYASLTQSGDSNNFTGSENYWQLGCVFDTLLDYMAEAVKADPSESSTATQLVSATWAKLSTLKKKESTGYYGYWYDDYGWWGIAANKSTMKEYSPFFKNEFRTDANGNVITEADNFKDFANYCWSTMINGKNDGLHFGADNVWDKCDQTFFARVAPKFSGGVWQYDIFKEKRAANLEDNQTNSNPSTPVNIILKDGKYSIISTADLDAKVEAYKKAHPDEPDTSFGNIISLIENEENETIYTACGLGPFQLTVVNGLYLILGLRMGNNTSKAASNKVFSFIKDWVNVDEKGVNPLIHKTLKLASERISCYKNNDAVYNYHADHFWGGDQGLLIGGMVDFIKNNPDSPDVKTALDIVDQIIEGVCTNMQKDGKVYPWYPVDYVSPTDLTHPQPAPAPMEIWDYPGGSGIFMRYLLYAFKQNESLRSDILNNKHGVRDFIINSANACQEGTLPSIQNGMAADNLWDWQNQLAVLTMAIHLLDYEATHPKGHLN